MGHGRSNLTCSFGSRNCLLAPRLSPDGGTRGTHGDAERRETCGAQTQRAQILLAADAGISDDYFRPV
jgi:hypothetical protein